MADAYKSQLLMSLWCYAELDHEKKVSLTVIDLASENAMPLTLKTHTFGGQFQPRLWTSEFIL